MSTKIKSITPKTFQGKVTGYNITLTDGTTGYLADKASDKDLKEGEEVNYTTEVKQNKQGGNYNLLTVKRGSTGSSSNTPAPQPHAPKTINTAQMKHENRLKCMELAHEAYVAGKLDNADAQQHAREWVALADDLTDGIFG